MIACATGDASSAVDLTSRDYTIDNVPYEHINSLLSNRRVPCHVCWGRCLRVVPAYRKAKPTKRSLCCTINTSALVALNYFSSQILL